MKFKGSYTGEEVDARLKLAEDVPKKQDIIHDLDAIREGAAAGATALQSVPEQYITDTELEAKGYLTEHQDISGKQDILVSGVNIKTVNGKSLLGSGNIQISGGTSGGGGSEVIIISQSEYDTLLSQGNIQETFIYFIKENDTPVALYIGTILIAQKDEFGNISFPYNFPIIF